MTKKTVNSILTNILWLSLSLLPVLTFLIFQFTGGKISGFEGNAVYKNFGSASVFLSSGISISTSSYLYGLLSDFFNLFNITDTYFISFFVWFFYIQIFRFIYNMVFFLFEKCHNYLEFLSSDTDNDLL